MTHKPTHRLTGILFAVLLNASCIGVAIAADGAPPAGAAPPSIKGKVVEVLEVESFSYFRLQTKDGELWAAVPRMPIKVGSEVTLENVTLMKDFQSKSLNRKFDRIAFGSLSSPGAPRTANDAASFHGNAAKAADPGDAQVAKANGPNAYTVAEIVTGRAKLKDQTVVLRGKIVKVTEAVLGKNWVHLRDGSGSPADGTNDIVVTTKDEAKVGDVVVAKGVVHTDRDFGAGYSYAVLIEEATLRK